LSSVLSSASLISRYVKEDEQDSRNRHINRIKDSVKHLNDLLEDFLSLGRLEEGKVATHFDVFYLKEFLEDVADEMHAILKPKQEILVNCQGTGRVKTDKKLLKNILINLVSNAVKFSSEGAAIKVHAYKDQDRLHLSVSDEGIGISEEDQQHLFTSFFRGKNATNIQGTGLGLHIVKRYADLLEGTLTLNSELDKGTTISLSVPQSIPIGE
jgi:signal transduction histidine kinase